MTPIRPFLVDLPEGSEKLDEPVCEMGLDGADICVRNFRNVGKEIFNALLRILKRSGAQWNPKRRVWICNDLVQAWWIVKEADALGIKVALRGELGVIRDGIELCKKHRGWSWLEMDDPKDWAPFHLIGDSASKATFPAGCGCRPISAMHTRKTRVKSGEFLPKERLVGEVASTMVEHVRTSEAGRGRGLFPRMLNKGLEALDD